MKKKKILTEHNTTYLGINACWWCVNHGIIIKPVVEGDEKIRLYVSIDMTGEEKDRKLIKSPKVYTNLELTEAIYSLYKALFIKHADKVIISKAEKNILKSV